MVHDSGRRRFIKQGLWAAALLSAPTLGGLPACQKGFRNPLERRGTAKKVFVLGAGLAGLAAAYELTEAGHDVTVFEAQGRPGGRVLTFRKPLADGLYAEAGAARIPHWHDMTIGYVKRFGLKLERFYPSTGNFVSQEDGERRMVAWREFADAMRKHRGLRLDHEWYGFHVNGTNYWHKIRGGNDLLPRAFAERLDKKVLYESPIKRIEQNPHNVRIQFVQRNRLQTMEGDRLICTIPFPVLRHIEVSPAFSERKREVIDGLLYAMAARICLQTSERFWEGRGENGFGVTDWPVEIWQPSFSQASTHGVLQFYLHHTEAIQMLAYGEHGRVDVALSRMDDAFPGTRRFFEQAVEKYWCQDIWAGGAYSAPRKGQWEAIVAAEGRVHFAGEHTSQHENAWMQGALESGYRAAHEVNEAS